MSFLRAKVLNNPYIPHSPTPQQAAFLVLIDREVLYGGAAGGGKTDALLMAALMYVDVPGYSAILFRNTFDDLELPGSLIPRSHEWLDGTDARWNGNKHLWVFPTSEARRPATLKFSYLMTDADAVRHRSSEYQYVGFDELSLFSEYQYNYLNSRLRRLRDMPVPIRMRGGTNPGGPGHEWVRRRFLTEGRLFVPAKLADNPHLDEEAYRESLKELDPITRAQLELGDWDARPEGGLLDPRKYKEIDEGEVPRNGWQVRLWDLAATVPKKGSDPDWTAGALVRLSLDGKYYVEHIEALRGDPFEVQERVKLVAHFDGMRVPIRMEREPGASGFNTIDTYARVHLVGFDFSHVLPSGSKEERARPLAAALNGGNVYMVRAPWNGLFLDQSATFPQPGYHDDLVDVVAYAVSYLALNRRREGRYLAGGDRQGIASAAIASQLPIGDSRGMLQLPPGTRI